MESDALLNIAVMSMTVNNRLQFCI